jgi:hypothetical protein
MSGIMPPPIFQKPRQPARSRDAEQRFYELHGQAFGYRLRALLAGWARRWHRLSGRAGPDRASGNTPAGAIDNCAAPAFKFALRTRGPNQDERAVQGCQCGGRSN